MSLYKFSWGNNPKRASLKGRLCRIIAAGLSYVVVPRGMAWLVAGDFHGSCLDVFAMRADSARKAAANENRFSMRKEKTSNGCSYLQK